MSDRIETSAGASPVAVEPDPHRRAAVVPAVLEDRRGVATPTEDGFDSCLVVT